MKCSPLFNFIINNTITFIVIFSSLHLILLLNKGGSGGRYREERDNLQFELATLEKKLKDTTEAMSNLPPMDVSSAPASASISELNLRIQSTNERIDTCHYTTITTTGKSVGK